MQIFAVSVSKVSISHGGEGFERKGRSGGEEREVMRNIGLLGMGT